MKHDPTWPNSRLSFFPLAKLQFKISTLTDYLHLQSSHEGCVDTETNFSKPSMQPPKYKPEETKGLRKYAFKISKIYGKNLKGLTGFQSMTMVQGSLHRNTIRCGLSQSF